MPIVVDIAHHNNFDHLWRDAIEVITKSNDKLKNNYLNLNPANFISFPVVIEDDKIVCFSALQMEERWGNKIARCSTRMWIHPDYRHHGKFTSGPKFLNTTYCLPIQIAKARTLNLDCLFISREDNLRGFEEYIKLVKTNSGTEFNMLSRMVNVCGITPTPKSCWQYIAVHWLNAAGHTTWNNIMSKFYKEEENESISI